MVVRGPLLVDFRGRSLRQGPIPAHQLDDPGGVVDEDLRVEEVIGRLEHAGGAGHGRAEAGVDAGRGAEAGADRPQRRADPDPHDAAGPAPGQRDRELHRPARPLGAGFSRCQHVGPARGDLREPAQRQARPFRRGGARPAADPAAADRVERCRVVDPVQVRTGVDARHVAAARRRRRDDEAAVDVDDRDLKDRPLDRPLRPV